MIPNEAMIKNGVDKLDATPKMPCHNLLIASTLNNALLTVLKTRICPAAKAIQANIRK